MVGQNGLAHSRNRRSASIPITRDRVRARGAVRAIPATSPCFSPAVPSSKLRVSPLAPCLMSIEVSDHLPTILVIDDEAAIRSALVRFFERRGWRCLQAADGGEAEALLFAGVAPCAYDVVLCDLRLPVKSGLELFHRALEERPDVAERFVLSSGDADGVIVQCPVLAKPFPLAEVASMADAILSRNKAA